MTDMKKAEKKGSEKKKDEDIFAGLGDLPEVTPSQTGFLQQGLDEYLAEQDAKRVAERRASKILAAYSSPQSDQAKRQAKIDHVLEVEEKEKFEYEMAKIQAEFEGEPPPAPPAIKHGSIKRVGHNLFEFDESNKHRPYWILKDKENVASVVAFLEKNNLVHALEAAGVNVVLTSGGTLKVSSARAPNDREANINSLETFKQVARGTYLTEAQQRSFFDTNVPEEDTLTEAKLEAADKYMQELKASAPEVTISPEETEEAKKEEASEEKVSAEEKKAEQGGQENAEDMDVVEIVNPSASAGTGGVEAVTEDEEAVEDEAATAAAAEDAKQSKMEAEAVDSELNPLTTTRKPSPSTPVDQRTLEGALQARAFFSPLAGRQVANPPSHHEVKEMEVEESGRKTPEFNKRQGPSST